MPNRMWWCSAYEHRCDRVRALGQAGQGLAGVLRPRERMTIQVYVERGYGEWALLDYK